MSHPFLETLLSQDWRARRQALDRLRRGEAPPAPELAEALVAVLRDDYTDLAALNAALQALAQVRQAPVTELAALAQRHPEPDVRMYAVQLLGALRSLPDPAPAQAALQAALDDPDENVRFHAIEALGNLAQPESLPALRRALQREPAFEQYAALLALANVGRAAQVPPPPGLVEQLLARLDDDFLYEAALEALSAWENPRVMSGLLDWLSQGPARSAAQFSLAAQALARMARRAPDTLPDLLRGCAPALQVRLAQAAREWAASAPLEPALAQGLARLAGALLDAPAAPEAALTLRAALADLLLAADEGLLPAGLPAAQALLRAAPGLPPEFASALAAADPDLSPALLRTLVEAALQGGQPVLPPLADLLLPALQSDQDSLSAAAAAALAQVARAGRAQGTAHALLQNTALVEALFAQLEKPEAAPRQAALEALLALQPPGLAERLLPLLARGPLLRAASLRGLAALRHPAAGPAALSALAEEDPQLRGAAVEALALIADPPAVDALQALLRDPDPRLRLSAVRALAGLPGLPVSALLREALSDPDAWVRMHACRALGQRALTGSEEALGAALLNCLNDPQPPVRVAALEALLAQARQSGPETRAALRRRVELLLQEENPDVRRAAQHALAQLAEGMS